MTEIDRLVEIMRVLRSDKGCPWDLRQDHGSLKPFLIEETYEVIDAIDGSDPQALKEELGDLLFQILFHCQLASERGDFDLKDVCDAIADKMISRHPHVFGNETFDTPEEVSRQWEQRKKEEGKNKGSIFEGIPRHLPALLKAHRVQSRASKVGFDWQEAREAMPKLHEELSELASSMDRGKPEEIEGELGDLLFSVVNVARLCKVNPEEALNGTIKKFIERFNYIARQAEIMDKPLSEMTLEEMDMLWEEAKEKRGQIIIIDER